MAYATLKFVPSPFLFLLHKSLIPSLKPVISIVNDILFKQCFRHFKSTIDLKVGAQKTQILLGA